MSRVGKEPVVLPEKVEVKVDGKFVSVKGPKGDLSYQFTDQVNIELKDKTVMVTAANESKLSRSLWGTTRSVINNMVVGVSEGFTKSLEFNGVGYKAAAKGKVLELGLGFSHPINYQLPEGITAKVVAKIIHISGCDKEMVGQVAAKVRSFRPPEPYKGKGIKYITEHIIRKAGKTGAK
ncbi:MAG: 50S ribosomal protein L6 [Epsilonproteobacteria bacterium]|nr:MAG: 50S ribosomal protein L6 [Campylobacterota bacterium]RLA66502.1 MAG: 50S ribosomal protein L6 [Campylobacterota bacterium]